MMETQSRFEEITNSSLDRFREKHATRERAIQASREVIRTSANAIRAIHRNEMDRAKDLVDEAGALVAETKNLLIDHPALYFTGYTTDAQQQSSEARCA